MNATTLPELEAYINGREFLVTITRFKIIVATGGAESVIYITEDLLNSFLDLHGYRYKILDLDLEEDQYYEDQTYYILKSPIEVAKYRLDNENI